MKDLAHLQTGMFNENSNPNFQIAAMQNLQRLRSQHNMSATTQKQARPDPYAHTTRSIHSDLTYNQSAVNDMNMNELDVLLEKNEKRIN